MIIDISNLDDKVALLGKLLTNINPENSGDSDQIKELSALLNNSQTTEIDTHRFNNILADNVFERCVAAQRKEENERQWDIVKMLISTGAKKLDADHTTTFLWDSDKDAQWDIVERLLQKNNTQPVGAAGEVFKATATESKKPS